MKINSIISGIAPAVLITSIFFVSCNKDLDSKSKVEASSNVQHATNIAALQSLLDKDDIEQFVLSVYPNSPEAVQILSGSCPPIVTYDPDPVSFPRTVTTDYQAAIK